MSPLGRMLKTHPYGRWLLLPYRLKIAVSHQSRPLARIVPWLVHSREITDFSYDLTPLSRQYLSEFLSIVTGVESAEISRYLDEISEDSSLRDHIFRQTLQSEYQSISDAHASPGKRVAWYALIRALKPRFVVEAGVNRGFGTCVIAAALLRNSEEGRAGTVCGIDIEPANGYLLRAPYTEVGEIIIADIRDYLRTASDPIDMFIHDTQNNPELEGDEYRLVEGNLTPDAVVCSVWASAEILAFARRTGRVCLSFAMEAERHWYPGARIAIAFGRG